MNLRELTAYETKINSIEDLIEKTPLPQTNCNTRYFGTSKKLRCSFTTYQKSDKVGPGKILEILI